MSKRRWIGQKLAGRYEIEELLGQGGMSAVYKGTDPNLRRTVAIKLIHAHLSEDPQFVSRFEEEAAAVAQLKHPNVIQVFDFDHDEDTYYMVLEFVPGETLQERLKRLNASKRRLSPKEAIDIAASICDALDFAHKRGMIHRDVKPANIMLNLQGQAILMDFGIAKIIGGKQHTATGAVVGTAMYMSPEQAKGELPDARIDVYALGVTLFEMLSGQPPFKADSAMTLMMMHVNDPVPDLSEITPDIPHELVAVVGKALVKDREQRLQTAGNFATALRSIDLHRVATTIEEQSSEAYAPTTIEPVEQPEAAAPSPGPTSIEERKAEAPPPRSTTIEEAEATEPRRGVLAVLTEAAGGRRGIVVGGAIIAGVLACAVLGAGGYFLFAQTEGDEVTPEPVVVVAVESATPTATETAVPPTHTVGPPTETPTPTLTPTATVPPGPYSRINQIRIENGRYIVEYETFEYQEVLPGMHVHFFFDTVPPEQAGAPGAGPWYLWGGPRPFDGYGLNDRPGSATQMCALVANPNHSIILETGNCVDLPEG